MPKYELSNDAQKDLFNIAVYGDLTFGEYQSDNYRDALLARFEAIANNPLLYPEANTKKGQFRKSVIGVHSIYYEIRQYDILIVRIIGMQDY